MQMYEAVAPQEQQAVQREYMQHQPDQLLPLSQALDLCLNQRPQYGLKSHYL